MSKLTLSNITSGYQTTVTQNANNDLIEAAVENTLSRNGASPNTMNAVIDMNGYNIINQGNPITVSGLVWEGPWITAQPYITGDIIESSGFAYICIVNHTSGVFVTDLMSLKWQVFVSGSLPSQIGETGKYLTTNGTIASWHTVVETTSTIGSAQLPVGTTAQRDGGQGSLRFNSDYLKPEVNNGTSYVGLGGATGSGGDDIFYENGQTVTTDYTITTNKNAMTAGPVTIADGISVTIPTGSTWSII